MSSFHEVISKLSCGSLIILMKTDNVINIDSLKIRSSKHGEDVSVSYQNALEMGIVTKLGNFLTLTEFGKEVREFLQGAEKLEHALENETT